MECLSGFRARKTRPCTSCRWSLPRREPGTGNRPKLRHLSRPHRPPELEIDACQCTPKGASLNSTEIQFPNCIWESGAGDGVIAPVATAAASLAGGAASPEPGLAGRLPLISRVPAALSVASSPAGATGQTRRSVQSWLMEQERGLPTPTWWGSPLFPFCSRCLAWAVPGRRLWQEDPQGRALGMGPSFLTPGLSPRRPMDPPARSSGHLVPDRPMGGRGVPMGRSRATFQKFENELALEPPPAGQVGTCSFSPARLASDSELPFPRGFSNAPEPVCQTQGRRAAGLVCTLALVSWRNCVSLGWGF